MKTCRECGIEKEYSEFQVEIRNSDGYRNQCKQCKNEYTKKKRDAQTLEDKAKRTYSSIKKRCSSKRYQEDRPRYIDVENKLDRDEFVKWYVANYFERCQVDRIDNDGHYEMSNIQLLSPEEHNKKKASERINLIEEVCVCNKCSKEYKYSDAHFTTRDRLKSSYNPLGIIEICRSCNKKDNK